MSKKIKTKKRILSYIEKKPRTRTEILREFRIKAKKLDEILESLKHEVKTRKLQTKGRPQVLYQKAGSIREESVFMEKARRERARRTLEQYMRTYNVEYPKCSVESCDNKATTFRFKDLSNPLVVAFLCSECDEFLHEDETAYLASYINVKDLRREQPRSRHAAVQYLRNFMKKHSLENLNCQICNSPETIRHIPNPDEPLETCFLCKSCHQKMLRGTIQEPKPVNVLKLKS